MGVVDRRGFGIETALTAKGLMVLLTFAFGVAFLTGFAGPKIGSLSQQLFGYGYEQEAIDAVDAVSYASNCAALANAWNPEEVDASNPVAQQYRERCGAANVQEFGARRNGELVGKTFGKTTVQCQMQPGKPTSGCNIYNFRLPQDLSNPGGIPGIGGKGTNLQHWLGLYEAGYGDPKYLMYYSKFPRRESYKWDSRRMSDRFSFEIVAASVAIEAASELIPGIGDIAAAARRRGASFVTGFRSGGRAYLKQAAATAIRGGVTGAARRVLRSVGAVTEKAVAARAAAEAAQRSTREAMERIGRSISGYRKIANPIQDGSALIRLSSDYTTPQMVAASYPLVRQTVGRELTDIPDTFSEDRLSQAFSRLMRIHGEEIADAADQQVVAGERFRAVVRNMIEEDDSFRSTLKARYAPRTPATQLPPGETLEEFLTRRYVEELGGSSAVSRVYTAMEQDDVLTAMLRDLPGSSTEASSAVIRAWDEEGLDYTADDIVRELREEVGDRPWISRLRNRRVFEGLAARTRRMFRHLRKVARDGNMGLSFASRATRRTALSLEAIKTADGQAVRRLSRASRRGDINWNDMFSKTAGRNYYKQAAEQLYDDAQPQLSRTQAARVIVVGRMKSVDEALEHVDKPLRKRLLFNGKQIGEAALDSTGGRLAAAEAVGEVVGQGAIQEQDYKAWGRCAAVPRSVTHKIGCLVAVSLAIHNVKQAERNDQFYPVGNQFAVDRNMELIKPETRETVQAMNWFLPAMTAAADRHLEAFRDDPENRRKGSKGESKVAMSFERRFRLASPCYADKIRIRHELIRGRFSVAPGNAPRSNGPSYVTKPELAQNNPNIQGATTDPTKAQINEWGERQLASEGFLYSGLNEGVFKEGVHLNPTDGTVAYTTGRTADEIRNGKSLAPPGYKVPEDPHDATGWQSYMGVKYGGSFLTPAADGYVRRPGGSQLRIPKERLSNFLWTGTVDRHCQAQPGYCTADSLESRSVCKSQGDGFDASLCGVGMGCCKVRPSSTASLEGWVEGRLRQRMDSYLSLMKEAENALRERCNGGAQCRADIRRIEDTRKVHALMFDKYIGLLRSAAGQEEYYPMSGLLVQGRPTFPRLFYRTFMTGKGAPTELLLITDQELKEIGAADTYDVAGSGLHPWTPSQGIIGVDPGTGGERDKLQIVKDRRAEGNPVYDKIRRAERMLHNEILGKSQGQASNLIGVRAANRIPYLPDNPRQYRGFREYYRALSSNYPSGIVPQMIQTAGGPGTKTMMSRPLKQEIVDTINKKWGSSKWKKTYRTMVEGLVYHVHKTPASEVSEIPKGTNYCYGYDSATGLDQYAIWFVYGGSIVLEVAAEAATLVTGPVGGAVAAGTSALLTATATQAVKSFSKAPWPASDKSIVKKIPAP